MRQFLLTGLLAFNAVQVEAEPSQIVMGDGTVRGERLANYEHTWIQCVRAEGSWTEIGPLSESLTAIGPLARHRQESKSPDGRSNSSITYFDHATLAPLRMEQEVLDADGAEQVSVFRQLSRTGYEGVARQGTKSKSLSGVVSSQMWHGGALGLPLATINPNRFPVRFASSMIGFDGTYSTVATLSGKQEVSVGGVKATARLIDVEWHHNESGDVYAPGPDGSGGRFWIVSDPPDGMPYVPQYQTDSYLVTTLADHCPDH